MPDHYNTMSDAERVEYVRKIRDLMGLTQANFASEIGMSVRAYSDIENGLSACRVIHLLAAERVFLWFAASTGRPEVLEGEAFKLLLRDVMDAARRRMGSPTIN